MGKRSRLRLKSRYCLDVRNVRPLANFSPRAVRADLGPRESRTHGVARSRMRFSSAPAAAMSALALSSARGA